MRKKQPVPWLIVVLATTLVLAMTALHPVFMQRILGYSWPCSAGLFGDMYGALNALFSGVAFVGLLVTLWMQRESIEMQRQELSLQREELKETRNELHASATSQEKQWKVMALNAELMAQTALHDSSWKQIDAIDRRVDAYLLTNPSAAKSVEQDKSDERRAHTESANSAKRKIKEIMSKLEQIHTDTHG